MYVLLLILFPILLLFHTYLAFGVLGAALVSMYLERTTPAKRVNREPEPMYKAGYED
jgi:hypothetical protein